MLWHKLSELPVVSIEDPRPGSELALACDQRFQQLARSDAVKTRLATLFGRARRPVAYSNSTSATTSEPSDNQLTQGVQLRVRAGFSQVTQSHLRAAKRET